MSPRRTLTNEERAERKRRAWDPNQFKKGKPGDPNQWKKAARALAGENTDANLLAWCEVLGLQSVPKTQQELKVARNSTVKRNREAWIGDDKASTEVGKKINEAYERLTAHIKDRDES